MIPTANQIYRHFKGNLYRIITIAKDAENGEDVVVYQALYGEYTVYTRALANFAEVLDRDKYPKATQTYRFELVQEMVEPVLNQEETMFPFSADDTTVKTGIKERVQFIPEEAQLKKVISKEKTPVEKIEQENQRKVHLEQQNEEGITIDPMLEAYLDTDSYRERLNILHGLQHRITEHMLLTMAVVIDFELPEGSIEQKYDALHDCLLTRERYECNRMI